ncbi:trace amine-associated receptor 1-like isoform X2 [Pecten maximus]|uniref:trace amine-associated receptor 1-like isoform X2 n=1 Tax=Pecten maximus TaxID=6579 RepID=UPI001458D05D|nr:trace amine-associated receptor 1-like isoform X2 [Pecten maximus]
MANNTALKENPDNHVMMNNAFYNSHISCGNLTETSDYFGTRTTVCLGIMLIVTIFAAVFGNLMVIVVIVKNRAMREMIYMFLLSLAIADLMIGALMAPLAFYNLLKECWGLPRFMCTLNLVINTTLLVTSIHTLMWMAVYKFICVKRVFSPPSRWVGNLLIVLAWAWGLLLAFLTTHFNQAVYKPKTMQCGPTYPINSYILHAANQLINLIIPIIVMMVAYIKIYLAIRQSGEFQRQHTITTEGRQRSEARAVAKTLFIVLLCFLLCWLPYFCYTNIGAFINDKGDIPAYLNAVAYAFGYMNSACNPIIYAWRFPEFRKGYKDILCKKPQYTLAIGPLGRPVMTTRKKQVRSSSAVTTTSNTSNIGQMLTRGSNGSVDKDNVGQRKSKEIELYHLGDDRDSVFLHADENNKFLS